jgi:hypothetical protein
MIDRDAPAAGADQRKVSHSCLTITMCEDSQHTAFAKGPVDEAFINESISV